MKKTTKINKTEKQVEKKEDKAVSDYEPRRCTIKYDAWVKMFDAQLRK